LPDEVDELLVRAEERLRAARHLLIGAHFSDAVSRAYYGMYFASTALLLSKGLTAKTHSGLVALVFEHFVRPGLLERDVAGLLPSAMAARHEADYGFPDKATELEASETLADAERFVRRAREILGRP
jgi:uncharacterized protein (UPF0332 family)